MWRVPRRGPPTRDCVAGGSGITRAPARLARHLSACALLQLTGMNKSGLLKGGDAAFSNKMKRNPNEIMSKLQQSMVSAITVPASLRSGWEDARSHRLHTRAAPARR